MEHLSRMVDELEATYRQEEQVRLLQELCDTLLESCGFLVGGRLYIPLWLEAYYFHPGKFEDENVHQDPDQQRRFGRLYFHRKGWGGVDICLSKGGYCLSFLIKYAREGEELFSQVALFRHWNSLRKAGADLENQPVLCPLPADQREPGPVYHSPRKGLVRDSFRRELLASLKGLDKYPFHLEPGYGKRRLAALYRQEQEGSRFPL